jgi:hypothetical protein
MNYFSQIARHTVRVFILFSLIILIARPSVQVQALATVFVSPTGTGAACSQSVPCSLATGLSTVDDGGTLYAAAGTYEGTGDQVVLLSRTINFYGGWSGASTGTPVRDPATYVSILEGLQERRGISIKGASVHPTVDGWTIQNGNATGSTSQCEVFSSTPAGCGGGIYVYQAEPTITNNIIRSNTAAVSVTGMDGAGGGIYILQSAGTLVRWNQIYSNDSHINGEGAGGGIYIIDSGGKTTIMENDIYENEDSSSTSFSHTGIGIFILDNIDQVQIYDNQIHDNNPDGWVYYGSAITTQYCDNKTLIDENNIFDNIGYSVVNASYSSPVIQQNTIINPDAGYGIFVGRSVLTDPIQTTLIYNNIVAYHDYGNVYILGSTSENTDIVLRFNTLSNSDYGLYIENGGNVTFDRGIISDHTDYGIFSTGDPDMYLAVTNTLFDDNTVDGVMGSNPFYGDPAFIDPAGYDFHLLGSSAAINTVTDGGTAEDIDDDDRPSGWGATPYDVGADEFVWLYDLFLPLGRKP